VIAKKDTFLRVRGSTSFLMPQADPAPRDLRTAICRAAIGRCPNCGQGSLFRIYLKQVDQCAVCGEPYKHIRAEDAPPWLTILIVGHIIVPLILIVETSTTWPAWLEMMIWPIASISLALAILPRAKGAFLALLWTTRAPGSER